MLVIFDIDGVLADCSHRLKYLENRDYDMFYSSRVMGDDSPINAGFDILHRILASGAEIAFCTGRPRKTRDCTKEWLKYYLPMDLHYVTNHLYMRKDGDHRKSEVVKPELVDEIVANSNTAIDDTFVFIDDMRENVDAVCKHSKGLVTGLVFVDKYNNKEM